ncbi:hypothetical protein IM697_08650 [Streptomyces ferrugineus]|uniref:Uncharacterized protein n=1 Tax=Streptomyces ferrugineus TaxID=1413221 RepID=A0A7M2SQ05_9ACTN|nr:hypothetical protein [Streptomyces ferrugineus]QOV38430.1 hypothetical protein IM697_08650 [Streptomyces ferrugineus]
MRTTAGSACSSRSSARPGTRLPLRVAAVNYRAFRGMLMKSSIYFEGAADIAVGSHE